MAARGRTDERGRPVRLLCVARPLRRPCARRRSAALGISEGRATVIAAVGRKTMRRRSRTLVAAVVSAVGLVLLLVGCTPSEPRAWTLRQAERVYAGLTMQTISQNMAKVQACAAEKQVAITPLPASRAYSYDSGKLSASENVRYGKVIAACAMKEDPNYKTSKLSDTQAKHLYELELVQASCLRRVGLKPTAPPDEGTFVRQIDGKDGSWDPLYSVQSQLVSWAQHRIGSTVTPAGAYSAAITQCPSPGMFVSVL
jgi:hypothetical protein